MGAPRHDQGWTEPRVARMKKLWLDGQSASDIARDLGGGVTRNGVIGKVHRLGLSERKGAGGAKPTKPTKTHFSPPKVKALPPAKPSTWNGPAGVPAAPYEPAEVLADKPPLNLSLMELPASGCKWPVNDGRPEYLFCGQRRFEGRPYCRGHCKGAFSAASVLGRHSPKELARSLRRYL